eukprot:GAHX01005247.1.p1 GENE.GAHX01005247.1~~GAHX01005247.1.p1  ORF type:complete len:50 (-),score=4.69 GAHX01005247.1:75-224(-)
MENRIDCRPCIKLKNLFEAVCRRTQHKHVARTINKNFKNDYMPEYFINV